MTEPRIAHNTRYFFDRSRLLYRWITDSQVWRDSLREMGRHLPPSAARLTVLELDSGSGNGVLPLLDSRPDLRIVGLDFSTAMPRLSLRERSTLHSAVGQFGIGLVLGEATRLPLPDNSIDAIAGQRVFCRLPNQSAFLQEAVRVLRPGGRLILLEPAAEQNPLGALRRLLQQPGAARALLSWYAVSRFHRRLTLEQIASILTNAGFARVLSERAIEGYGILSRGEKPYPALSSIERIAQTAALDGKAVNLQVLDSAALPSIVRGRFVFLLVRQTPDKPPWAIQPGEAIRWDAATVAGEAEQSCLLAFTSLPKAVEFMQPAITTGLLKGINKVAKFEKVVTPQWHVKVLLNPPFDMLRESGHYAFNGVTLPVDPASAEIGDE